MTPFAHLHVHSEFSLLDGACRVEEMAAYAASMGQEAMAITDHGVMYGAVAFYKAAKKAGVKPIIGCEVYVAPKSHLGRDRTADSAYSHLILLCKNETGYRNLCELVSLGFTEGFYIKPRISWELLHTRSEGLICLSGCVVGEIPQLILAGNYAAAKTKAQELYSLFGEGNFYLELQNHGIDDERRAMNGLLRIHEETGIPIVLTNDAHYMRREDATMHDVLLCIQTGKTLDDPGRMKFPGDSFYLKSGDEMAQLLPSHPEAIENTLKIAEACNFDFEFGHYHLPAFELPEGETDSESYLRKLCEAGFARRYPNDVDGKAHSQMLYEIDMIVRMGFVEYFLIVQDFVNYAKRAGIPVGPGRGSAAGSVVSYCLSITDVDPMRYSLYFERFLNPERVSMPDIDMDFCIRRRSEVIEYVNRKYGSDHVAQIVTFGTMAARNAVRDVGRVMGMSYADTDTVAKLIPADIKMTLEKALVLSPKLKDLTETDPQVKKLIDTAKALEGMPRHASTHAAGVVITRLPVSAYVPLAKNDESVVTQYQMTTLEELGLLKMDFLGLRNLTVLDDALQLVRKTDPDFAIETIPEDDSEVFSMLCRGKTCGVFQLESTGITGVCIGLKPRSIEDITALIALYRPGPMESIPRFLDWSAHPEKIVYKHPLLESILGITYGCIVYQEQVIDIFRRLAGFSLGQADMIRRAMSKKKEKEIIKERQSFIYGDPERNIPGAVANGVPEDVAGSIYDEILDFANYAFNKAHAVSYAIVAYRTAYMKVHWPKEYMAALITSVLGSSAKVAEYTAECRDMGINLLPPDINESGPDFTISGNAIRFGLAAIKNVGHGFAESVLAERRSGGVFKSFEDFCTRMYNRELNRRAVESLIRAGAFDCLGLRRRALLQGYELIIDGIASAGRKTVPGQFDLFGGEGSIEELKADSALPDVPEFSERERMMMEHEMTGIYLSGHPMDAYRDKLAENHVLSIGSLLDAESSEAHADGENVLVAGMVTEYRTRKTKKDTLMAYVTLEDAAGSVELMVFQKMITASGNLLGVNNMILVSGKLSLREDKEPQILVDTVRPLSDLGSAGIKPAGGNGEYVSAPAQEKTSGGVASSGYGRHVPGKQLYVRLPTADAAAMRRIQLLIQMFPGNDKLTVFLADTRQQTSARCGAMPSLVAELTELYGAENVVLRENEKQ